MATKNLKTITSVAFTLIAGIVAAPSLSSCSGPCEEKLNCGPFVPPGGAGAGGAVAEGGHETGGSSSGKGGSTGGSASGNGGSTVGGMAGESGGDGGAGGIAERPCGGNCPTDKPVCKEANDTCVQCLKENDCAAGPMNKCDAMNTCVECLVPDDCGTANKARCESGACVECERNDDCDHIAGKGVCDGGTCVQCTIADETACAGKSCNPATNACTNTAVGSVSTCKPCLTDSECVGGAQADPDARCVPMEFQGAARPRGFCLRRAVKTCGRPYTIAISSPSLSGAPSENYCGIDQQNVTCEAVVDLEDSRTCVAQPDAACGCLRDAENDCISPGKGGLCRDFAVVQDRCTYRCGVHDHCPEGLTCAGSPTKFCQ